MSDAVAIAMISGLTNLVLAYMNWKMGRKVSAVHTEMQAVKAEVKAEVVAVKDAVTVFNGSVKTVGEQVETVHKAINSRMDELLAAEKSVSKEEGKEEQKAKDEKE